MRLYQSNFKCNARVFNHAQSYTCYCLPHLKIYRTSTTDRAWTVTADAQVQIVTPTVGTYGAYTTFEYDGFTGFSGYALGDIVTPIIGLPVELINFDVKCQNEKAIAKWTTASENDFDYFELERATDAVHFSSVGKVFTTGNSTQTKHYELIDEYPSDINYYRLKQVDKNNANVVYSSIVMTKCNAENNSNSIQAYFPNNHSVKVTFSATTTQPIQFNLYEISGKLLQSNTLANTDGNNEWTINLQQQLAKGIYVLQVVVNNQTTFKKISLQ